MTRTGAWCGPGPAKAGTGWSSTRLDQQLSGIENLSLIPGTVGAAPLQNIGAYGAELRDTFEHLGSGGNCHRRRCARSAAAECGFGYRESVFKNAAQKPVRGHGRGAAPAPPGPGQRAVRGPAGNAGRAGHRQARPPRTR
ncbi:MAG: hypothetical protein WKG07_29095 [Hymenobacter sp.]